MAKRKIVSPGRELLFSGNRYCEFPGWQEQLVILEQLLIGEKEYIMLSNRM
jgi:hypothetical protein